MRKREEEKIREEFHAKAPRGKGAKKK